MRRKKRIPPSRLEEDTLINLEQEKKATAEEEIDFIVARSKVKERKKKLFMKRLKIGGGSTLAILLVYGVYLLFKPYNGTMAFGICKVFIELNTQFPDTIRLSTVEEVGMSVRIWYTQTDSFGAYRLEPMQCYFKEHPEYGFALDKVTIKRREIDPAVIERFNASLPVILQNPPDLALPNPLPDSLENLQFDFAKFRKPIL